MAKDHAHILVVDDNRLNRMLLERSLVKQHHAVMTAENGRQALELLRAHLHEHPQEANRHTQPGASGTERAQDPGGGFDVVLLDILMPEMDGYQTLQEIKADPQLRHIPVIMISGLDEIDSVVRCIEMGAEDYLNKPFNPALLHARVNASLASKRLRDLELEYLEGVSQVIRAAAAVEAASFELSSLDEVAAREDALGQLARVFQAMAHQVQAREERLKQQVQDLRIEIDTAHQAKRVAEITESDFFKRLREEADRLRGRKGGA